MSDRIYINDRNPDAWSIRSALSKLSAEDIENPLERDILLKYQDALRQLNKKNQELYDTRELLRNIHAGDDKNYLADTKKGLQESASTIASQIDTLDRQLIELQEDPLLKPVIDREKDKWHQREEQRSKEALARYREKAAETQRELMERYQKSRQEALLKREQTQQQQKQETIKETETPIALDDERKLLNMLTSKRFAAVISILLCVFLYFALLTTAFSTKVNTYICYTQSKDDQFHDITCWQLKGNSVEETTVYHVSESHVRCEHCKPSDKITITDRNYIIPIIISVPISAAVFLLLTYKKKQKRRR